ncbi:MAG: porin family protein [Cyclobacteriaceae bacterium]
MIIILISFTPFSLAKKKEMGIVFGINFSDTNGDSDIQSEGIIDLQLGGYYLVNLTDNLNFQTELLWIKKGYGFGIDDRDVDLAYFQIPLLLQLEINRKSYVSFGPYLSYLAKAKLTNPNSDITRDFKRIEYGLNLGAFYQISQRTKFYARANFGLNSIFDSAKEKTIVAEFGVNYSLFNLR